MSLKNYVDNRFHKSGRNLDNETTKIELFSALSLCEDTSARIEQMKICTTC